jgi:hypothetical protein
MGKHPGATIVEELIKLIASNEFKLFAGIGQTVLKDPNGLSSDLRMAISKGLKLTRDLQDQLFIIENLLEAVEMEGFR